jgi:hypothetical protein
MYFTPSHAARQERGQKGSHLPTPKQEKEKSDVSCFRILTLNNIHTRSRFLPLQQSPKNSPREHPDLLFSPLARNALHFLSSTDGRFSGVK